MLNMLRGFAGGYTAKILIGLLIASFALWGISGSILSGSNTVVQVGNTKIDTFDFRLAYENQLLQLSRQFNQRLTREQANAFGLQESVLARAVSGAVLDENSSKMGLGLSDKYLAGEIAKDPTFQDFSGQFSETNYKAYLRQVGLSEKDFLADRKKIAMRNQIQQGTSASYDMPQAFIDAVKLYDNEKRVFDYVVITPDALDQTPEPSDEQIKEYYEANKDSFRAPEYRKVTLLDLQGKDLAKPAEVSEEDLKAAYESRAEGLRSAEMRRVEQLVLKDQAEADMVAGELKKGKSFEEIVSDLGKKTADIDLGLIKAEDLPDENIRKVAFEAELNKPSKAIEGIFGPVIIRVTEIQEAKSTSYEEIEEQLRNELALQKGGEEVFELYDSVEDERAAGTSVKETAEKLELKTRVIEAIDAQGRDKSGNPVANLPVPQQLVQTLFQTEPGDDTQPLPIGTDGYVWFEVNEIIPDRQKELDEVKEEVKAAWINAEIKSQVQAIAETIAEEVKSGKAFNAVLAEKLGEDSLGGNVTYKTSEPVSRDATPLGLSAEAIKIGFSEKLESIHTAASNGNDQIVLRVAKIEMPEDANVDDATKEQLNSTASDDILTQVVQDFQSRENVTVNRNAMAQAFTVGQGGY